MKLLKNKWLWIAVGVVAVIVVVLLLTTKKSNAQSLADEVAKYGSGGPFGGYYTLGDEVAAQNFNSGSQDVPTIDQTLATASTGQCK